jgi:predicted transposase YbfD/YdcC
MQLVLMALCARQENILAISQWVHQHQDFLLNDLGVRTLQGEAKLPSQATLYRFLWSLEEQIGVLEKRLQQWALELVLQSQQDGRLLCLNLDGKHLKGSARSREGEKALHLLAAFVQEVGVTLFEQRVEKKEAAQAKKMLPELVPPEDVPWLITGDAAFLEKKLVKDICANGGMYLFDLKKNRQELLDWAQWTFTVARCEQDSVYSSETVRSGELWCYDYETRPVPAGLDALLLDAKQFIRCIRRVIDKKTGEIREEVEYAVTSLSSSAQELAYYWRGHWGIENRLHHKRDTVFREDDCRTRKAANVLAAFRNLILGLLHASGCQKVLERLRCFAAQPHLIPGFLGIDKPS